MAIINNLIATGMLLLTLTGCITHAETIPDTGASSPETSKTEESVNQNGVEGSEQTGQQTAAEPEKEIVTLVVLRDEEYVLDDEQAKVIFDLFYNHEMQTRDSPAADIQTLTFRIGEDYLYTSFGDFGTLVGRVNGELVIMDLSSSEYETLYQIASQYASPSDVP